MNIEEVKHYLNQKESEFLEFKESKRTLDQSSFETICAFLNHKGGVLLLGVKNDGTLVGVEKSKVESMKSELITTSNNWQKLNPPFIVYPEVFTINSLQVIAVRIPVSSQVHRCNNNIFIRSGDADLRVTQSQQIDEIYRKKRNYFTENEIFPFLKREHLRDDLFRKARNLMKSHNPDHPWLSLNDDELLVTSGLHATDHKTGESGYTLACALLFGTDQVIHQILPQYSTDAMVRIENLARYDDRLPPVQTNLIDAYEQLMGFVAKHLDDKFHMEGDLNVSIREKIFREVIANLIVHREYANAMPASFIIFKDRVEIKNANNPKELRPLILGSFEPYQKNPNIARFYRAIGRGEEIGSGIYNVDKYLALYTGNVKAVFKEDDIFTTIVPLTKEIIKKPNEGASEGAIKGAKKSKTDGVFEGVIEGAIEGATKGLKEKLVDLLKAIAINEGKRVPDYRESTGTADSSIERYIKQLKEAGLIEFIGDAPQTGGYYLTKKMKEKLK